MRLILLAVIVTSLAAVSSAANTSSPAMLGRLTINQTHIVFTYAGDLWSVDRASGEARRLTTNPAEENYPVFSPDGSKIAFSRLIAGNWDIYVMPAGGGEATQITYHPRNEYAHGWTPDGKGILFMSNLSGQPRLYTINVDGVLQTELPLLPEAVNGSFSPDGKR